jgi:subtilisin family serine protease
VPVRKSRVAPPQVAFQVGLMPLASTGMSAWRLMHPTWDGRGVLIAVLDGGVDPGVQGLLTTSTGEPKILDVRDLSGENDVPLELVRVDSSGRVELAGGIVLTGLAGVRAAAQADAPWYAGVVIELPLGKPPYADLNGNGNNRDRFGVLVVRTAGRGWVAFVDTNGDGSLADEHPMADYVVQRERFTFRTARGPGLVTEAINLREEGGRPHLALVPGGDHGTHVAGIAAGHMIYGVAGFDGVAPGAQILSLKISNQAHGGVSTTGSMLRGMQYAYAFAQERHLPLVMNMSFGVGNAHEGRAVMDSIVDAFLMAHPDVFFAVAAGNDGPGTSTTGEPGSSELAVGVGAAYPSSFAALQFGMARDVLGWWSARGGELAKPDIVAPGVAYSTVPAWDSGGEIKGGTSMAAPYVAGLAAVLMSAMIQEGRAVTAAALTQALRATARPFAGESFIDQGPGLAQVEPALQYLRAGHEAPRVRVHEQPLPASLPAGIMASGSARQAPQAGVAPVYPVRMPPGAYRRAGLAAPGDTIQRFHVGLLPDAGVPRRARTFRLVSDAHWVRPAAPTVTLDALSGSAIVDVHYDRAALARPGRYSAAVRGISATDSTAAPAFVLVNTVIVPDTIALVQGGRVEAGTTARYYVAVPQRAGGLSIALTARDTTMRGSISVFDPTGRPARGDHSDDVGGEAGGTAQLAYGAEDLAEGVWEIVVQAFPGGALVYDLTGRISPIHEAIVDTSGASPVIGIGSSADTIVAATLELIGAATTWEAAIENGGPWTRRVSVPAWAKKMFVEVEVTPDLWDAVTDFGITVFDPTGNSIGNGAMNYPYHRVAAELPQDRPAAYEARVELSPGFASPVAPPRSDARVRVRFEGDPRTLTTAPGLHLGVAQLPVPAFAPFDGPVGWQPLLRLRVGGGDHDQAAMTQLFTLPAPR